MGSVRLPSDMPSLEDGVSIGPESLSKRIQNYCQERRDKRKHEWETLLARLLPSWMRNID